VASVLFCRGSTLRREGEPPLDAGPIKRQLGKGAGIRKSERSPLCDHSKKKIGVRCRHVAHVKNERGRRGRDARRGSQPGVEPYVLESRKKIQL